MADCTTQRTLKEAHMQLVASVRCLRTPHSRTDLNKTCQLTGTVHGPTRRPHFSLAINSVTIQLWTGCFGLYRHTLTQETPSRNLEYSSWDILYI
jgi:hypothetical protein